MAPSTFYIVDLSKKDKSKKRKLNSSKLNLSKLNGISPVNQNNQKRARLNSAGSCSSDSCSSGSESSCSASSEQDFVFSFKKSAYKPTVRSANQNDNILDTIRRETSVPPCLTPIPSGEQQPQISEEKVKTQEKSESSNKSNEPVTPSKDEVDDRETYRRSPNGFLLAAPLPKGEILVDTRKQPWRLGKTIGCGGFGEIYLASRLDENGVASGEDYVIKLEPHDNGPLFVEINFYLRAAKEAQIQQYREERKDLTHLGVPSFIGSGSHQRKTHKYRFLVMRRYGVDLQKILDNSKDKKFTTKTICAITLQVIDSLEYMHHQGYVHKDVKGSNLLVGLGKTGQHLVNLVDFGLSAKYRTLGHLHKQYVHDERWAHEGTIEYTSRDAHVGCASRRGDFEVLVYNLVEWAGGRLPWDRESSSCDTTKAAKFWAFSHIDAFLKTAFKEKNIPRCITELMRYINQLHFEDRPNYEFVRDIFKKEAEMEGAKLDGLLDFQLRDGKKEENKDDKQQVDVNNFVKKQKGDEDARVSTVFDKQCIPEPTWLKKRENIISKIAKESMDNPTQAMIDVAKMMKKKEKKEDKVGKRKRNLSRRWSTETPPLHRGTSITPAMEDVMKLCKISEDPNEVDKNGFQTTPTGVAKQGAILPSGVQLFDSLLPSITLDDTQMPTTLDEVETDRPSNEKLSKTENKKKTGSLKRSRTNNGRVAKGELRHLQSFLPDPKAKTLRRTRSAFESGDIPKRQLRLLY